MKPQPSTKYVTVIITRTTGAAIVRDDNQVTALPIATVPTFWDKYKEKTNGQ